MAFYNTLSNIYAKETKMFRLIIKIIACQVCIANTLVIPQYSGINNTEIRSNISRLNFRSKFNIPSKYLTFTDDERNTILQQFEEINNDLDATERTINVPARESKLRLVRSLSKQTKCTISKDTFTNSKKEIASILANVSVNINQSTCTMKLNDTDNCNELVKVLQCGIQHFRNGFVEVFLLNNGTIEEKSKWKNAYISFLDKYEQQSKKLKESLSEVSQYELYKLEKDLYMLGQSLNMTLERLESTLVSLCIYEIKNIQIEDAIEHSKDLQPISMSQVIKQSYCFGNDTDCGKITINILEFLRNQSNIDNGVVGFETFYEEMYSKNDTYPIKVFLLGMGIENSTAKDKLQGLLKKIENSSEFNEGGEQLGKALGEALAHAMAQAFGEVIDRTVKGIACALGVCVDKSNTTIT